MILRDYQVEFQLYQEVSIILHEIFLLESSQIFSLFFSVFGLLTLLVNGIIVMELFVVMRHATPLPCVSEQEVSGLFDALC